MAVRSHLGVRLALSTTILLAASVVADRLAAGLAPAIPPPQLVHPPDFREVRTTTEFSYEFRTNALGLRYRDLPLKRKSSRELRVVLAGDSFTEGYGVADEDRFSSRLERRFSTADRPAAFINAALSGAGPIRYGRSLLVVGMRYRPDLAVIVVHGNDVHDTGPDERLRVTRAADGTFTLEQDGLYWPPGSAAGRLAHRIWPWTYVRLQHISRSRDDRELRGSGFLSLVRARAERLGIPDASVESWLARIPPDWLEAAEAGRLNGSLLAHGLFVPEILRESLDIEGASAEGKWRALARALTDIASNLQSAGVPLAVVYSPVAAQHDPSVADLYRVVGVSLRDEWLAGPSEFETRLEAWAAARAVPYLSLTTTFQNKSRERPGLLNFTLDSHWTPAGHELAADRIGTWLTEAGLLSER